MNDIASPPSSKLFGTGHRLVAFHDQRFYWYDYLLQRAKYERAHVYTGSSYPLDDGIETVEQMATVYSHLLHPTLRVLGNEWNIEGDASWPGGEDLDDQIMNFVYHWNLVAPIYKSISPDVPCYIGIYSKGVEYLDFLETIWSKLEPRPDGIDFHLYIETLEEAEEVLVTARARFMCEIACLEWNDSTVAGVRAFQRMLNVHTDHSCFIPYRKGQIPDLPGLFTESGHYARIGTEYKRAIARKP